MLLRRGALPACARVPRTEEVLWAREHRRPPAAAATIPLSSPLRRAALTFTQTRTWSPVPTNAAPG